MAIVHANDDNFQKVIGQHQLVLVDFWAPWCSPCGILATILDELNAEMGNHLTIVKVNVDENPIISSGFGIMSIPTIKLFKDGVELSTLVGVQPIEKLKAIVQQQM